MIVAINLEISSENI